jgi:hypothetical protein
VFIRSGPYAEPLRFIGYTGRQQSLECSRHFQAPGFAPKRGGRGRPDLQLTAVNWGHRHLVNLSSAAADHLPLRANALMVKVDATPDVRL